MIDARTLTRFSGVAEMTLIELGSKDGVNGYWFSDRAYNKVFVTERDIHERLDRRRRTFFSGDAEESGVV